MIALLDNPAVNLPLTLFAALFCLVLGWAEVPPRRHRKTGRERSAHERWSATNREGKVFLIIGVLWSVAFIAGIAELFY